MHFLVAALLAALPAQAPSAAPGADTNASIPANPGAQDTRIDDATSLINAGKPAAALERLDGIIAEFEERHPPRSGTQYYSARSMIEALLYAATPAAANSRNTNVIVTDRNWGEAYFLKGFALIDAKRSGEALVWLEKAVALAPFNAHYLAERAEWHKSNRNWDRAYDEFRQARDASEFSEDDVKVAEKGRAIRGMAFARVEQGRFDEAEDLIRQALTLNPSDAKARSELEFIAAQRSEQSN